MRMIWKSTFQTEFDCPGDGLCSNQGSCDENTGICICHAGFEGTKCEGNYVMFYDSLWRI